MKLLEYIYFVLMKRLFDALTFLVYGRKQKSVNIWFNDMPHALTLLSFQDVGLWLEEINLGGYRQIFKENGVNGEYLEGMSMFTTEQILRFIRRCHMKWGDFITLCKELRRIKGCPLSLSLCLSSCGKSSGQLCIWS